MDFTQESENLLTRKGLLTRPIDFWSFTNDPRMVNAEPNIIHQKIFEMEQKGILSGVVTQNIDGLHQKAGNTNVIEIHGTANEFYCQCCGKESTRENLPMGEVPICPRCGLTHIRPDFVLYGENLPHAEFCKAKKLIRSCDLLIVVGTSLSVEPAASLISYASYKILINNQSTICDSEFDYVLIQNAETYFKNLHL